MKLSQVQRSLAAQWVAGNAGMIWGPPAIGKSDGVRQLAARQSYTIPADEKMSKLDPRLAEVYGRTFTGRRVFDVRLLLCDPTDIKGLPVFDPVDRRANWVMSGLFPMDPKTLRALERELIDFLVTHPDVEKRTAAMTSKIDDLIERIIEALHEQHGVIFLDEIAAAPPSVQGAAFQLVLDRQIGTYTVPKRCSLVAAGNQQKHGAGAHVMLTPLLSRFSHYFLAEPSAEDWVNDYAIPNGIAIDITGYLRYKPDALFQFDPKKLRGQSDTANTTFPSPRTWVFASRFLEAARQEGLDNGTEEGDYIVQETLTGIVGGGAALEFIAWRKLYKRLPDPNLILDGKLSYDKVSFERADDRGRITVDLSLKFTFLLGLLNNLIKEKTADRAEHFMSFLLRDSKDKDFLTVTCHQVIKSKDLELLAVLARGKSWKTFAQAANFSQAMAVRPKN